MTIIIHFGVMQELANVEARETELMMRYDVRWDGRWVWHGIKYRIGRHAGRHWVIVCLFKSWHR